jgi:hypothetical protein
VRKALTGSAPEAIEAIEAGGWNTVFKHDPAFESRKCRSCDQPFYPIITTEDLTMGLAATNGKGADIMQLTRHALHQLIDGEELPDSASANAQQG